MNKKILAPLLAAGVLLAAWFIAAPWLTVYQIGNAAQSRDAQALAEHVDFASVRQSLKDQIKAMMLDKVAREDGGALNPLAALIAPLAGAVVDGAVDAYLTPAGLARLMAGTAPREGAAKPGGEAGTPEDGEAGAGRPLAGADMGYAGMHRFIVTAHGRRGDTRFVLRRQGLGWKLSEIILPLN
ncbi:DUF2939 domain-containing protein [Comamonas sp. NLF-1-9]|uniref:DUF2939 domain-containing protein n=1 Tax=Comamonas sp. NLF-1-9 TaxID=2853163 RepID=UPI001C47BA94|nr:DUF2939 domain-containing protein [Comamonas sp. NLF-1-9]QXL83511.1 DUF2939 domain-containing protein [Comamonas sp. NLF-1-9]